MWGIIMDKTKEAIKFNKFLYANTKSNEISFEKYMELLGKYVQEDELIPDEYKHQFEVTMTYFMSLLDVFDIEKNKTIVYEVE